MTAVTRVLVVVTLGAAIALAPAASIADTKRFQAAGSAGEWRWEPEIRRIVKGDRIVWKNPTGTTHTVTAWKGNWSKDTQIASGESTAKRFRRAGVYRFRCTVGSGTSFAHSTVQDGKCSGMCGTVRVRQP